MSINLTIQATNLTFNSPNGCLPDSCWFKYTIIQLLGVLSILIDSCHDTFQRSCLSSHSSLQSLIICIDGSLCAISRLSSSNSIGLCLNSLCSQVLNSGELVISLNKSQEVSNSIKNILLIVRCTACEEASSILHQLVSSLILCIIRYINLCQLILYCIEIRNLLSQLLLELANLNTKVCQFSISGLSIISINDSIFNRSIIDTTNNSFQFSSQFILQISITRSCVLLSNLLQGFCIVTSRTAINASQFSIKILLGILISLLNSLFFLKLILISFKSILCSSQVCA